MFTNKQITHTRTINKNFGLFGFAGLLGFLGFLPSINNLKEVMPVPIFFFFFAFFGFFGFYYEGKMSNTLIDERFKANEYKAIALSNRIALFFIFIVAIFSMSVFKIETAYTMCSILIATIGLAFGFVGFAGQYFLYRFENEE